MNITVYRVRFSHWFLVANDIYQHIQGYGINMLQFEFYVGKHYPTVSCHKITPNGGGHLLLHSTKTMILGAKQISSRKRTSCCFFRSRVHTICMGGRRGSDTKMLPHLFSGAPCECWRSWAFQSDYRHDRSVVDAAVAPIWRWNGWWSCLVLLVVVLSILRQQQQQ